MHPDLFGVPGTSCVLHSYGLIIMLAFGAAVWSGGRLAQKSGISKDLVVDLGIVSMISGILGAKINYLIQYPQDLGAGSPLFDLSDGGLSPLGALAARAAPTLVRVAGECPQDEVRDEPRDVRRDRLDDRRAGRRRRAAVARRGGARALSGSPL